MNFFKSKSFAIDLGNDNTILTDRDQILFSQPSYIVFERGNNKVKAVGDDAYSIFEKNPDNLKPVKPLTRGVIADYTSATKMIWAMVSDTFKRTTRFTGYDTIISGVPFYTSAVERRALRESLEQFNPRKTQLLFEPLAAAMGMGLNIEEPDGKMIVDIGGGITEIVIISLSGVVVFQYSLVAGDVFNQEIQRFFQNKYGIAIGIKTAEQVKINLGAAWKNLKNTPEPRVVKGKDIRMGIPTHITVTHDQIFEVLKDSIATIEQSIIKTLQTCPPELAGDIYKNGIYVTGGGALIRGLRERFEHTLGLPVHIDPHPLLSVSLGISKTLHEPLKYKTVLI